MKDLNLHQMSTKILYLNNSLSVQHCFLNAPETLESIKRVKTSNYLLKLKEKSSKDTSGQYIHNWIETNFLPFY